MRQRAWLFGIAGAAVIGCVCVSLWGTLWGPGGVFPAGDYPRSACDGCDSAGPAIAALAHGHLTTFFSTQPFMGSVSLALRAPFVALVTWLKGDFVAVYRVGTLVCLLAAILLLLPAFSTMLRRGQQPFVVLAVLAAIVLGPATFKAVTWGHPEELLGAALSVAAVVAAVHRRGIFAGTLLGLAVATKQWGLLAVIPTLVVAVGQRRQVASAAVLVGGAFLLPMLVGDPRLFLDQNFHTASAQLGVTATNVWWIFHRPGFDPSIHQALPVIPSPLREVAHPLALALMLGLSIVYWWRSSKHRHPYDAVQLLALLFLIRCVFDPLTISYHHAPFVVAIGIFEGLRRRGIPVVTLTSTAVLITLTHFVTPLSKPDLTYAVYLAWALPTIAYLTTSTFRTRITRTDSARGLDQPPAAVAAPAY